MLIFVLFFLFSEDTHTHARSLSLSEDIFLSLITWFKERELNLEK